MSFGVNVTGEGALTKVFLMDTSSGCIAEIFAFGALLNSFSVPLHEGRINVIDGYSTVEEARELMTAFFKSSKLSPFACRIKNANYSFGQGSYHLTKFSKGSSAIHGLIYDAVFSVVNQSADETEACVTFQYVYDNDSEGYPFSYRCEVEYTLTANNSLTITTTITNIDEQLMPVADGWHPYFTLGDRVDECQLEFQSKEMLEFDEDLVPTGRLIPYQVFGSLEEINTITLDNCFTVNFAECQPLCVFRNPKKKVQVEIYPATSYPYLLIFTPDHRKSIAIENLSAAPDAFNNGIGLKVLAPDESASYTTKFVIHPL
jgi:aldose 1-epimerase